MNHQLQFDVSETVYRIPYAFSRKTITSIEIFLFNLYIQFVVYFAKQKVTIILVSRYVKMIQKFN